MTSQHVLVNRENWDRDAPNWVERGRRSWAGEPTWGIWWVPEADLGVLPDDVEGLDAVELGCGTAYVSAWLARRGARPVALDNSSAQLVTARMLQDEFELRFPLIHGDAEHAPFRGASFDLAISEYGAAIWCDPYVWIPEAARILRPGGRLIFLGHSPILQMTFSDDPEAPATDRLQRPYFGMHRFEWDDPKEGLAIEFALPHGETFRLLRENGFEIEELLEVRAPEGAVTPSDALTSAEWSKRWPCEDVWKARKVR